jgi:hypothetical protein
LACAHIWRPVHPTLPSHSSSSARLTTYSPGIVWHAGFGECEVKAAQYLVVMTDVAGGAGWLNDGGGAGSR